MGFVSDLFNSSKGAGFQASGANIITPATKAQADEQYANAQNGLSQQNAFIQALSAQKGIGNQSSVYNQLQGVANGTGPNPAQAMLAQQTGANVANQAALMAGQRGAGSNVGLMARQAAQQGANTQQQAVGQGATMQANQSMNALNSMGNIAGQQVANQANATNAYSNAAQGEQQNILGAIQASNNANVSMQSNQNTANASIAAGNAKSQGGLFGGALGGLGSLGMGVMTGGASTALGMAHGGKVKMADGGVAGAPSNAPTNANGPKSKIANILKQTFSQPDSKSAPSDSPIESGFSKFGEAIGSGIHKIFGSDDNSGRDPETAQSKAALESDPEVQKLGLNAMAAPGTNLDAAGLDVGAPAMDQSAAPSANDVNIGDAVMSDPNMMQTAHKGGKIVPALLSPGEKYLNPSEASEVAKGKASVADVGKTVPGKAKVQGDSLKNDVVPAKLQEGGLVIPRSQMKDMSSAIKFVHAHMSKQRALSKGKK